MDATLKIKTEQNAQTRYNCEIRLTITTYLFIVIFILMYTEFLLFSLNCTYID